MASEQEIEDITEEINATMDEAVADLSQEEAIEVYNAVAYHAKVGADGIREDMK